MEGRKGSRKGREGGRKEIRKVGKEGSEVGKGGNMYNSKGKVCTISPLFNQSPVPFIITLEVCVIMYECVMCAGVYNVYFFFYL